MTTHDEPMTREDREKVLDELSALDQELGLDKMTHTKPPADLLAELYDLSDGGTAEWWVEQVQITEGGDWYYDLRGALKDKPEAQEYCERLLSQHALDLIERNAERWLRGRGWNIISPGDVHEREYEHEPRGSGYISLPDALRAEAGRK